MPVFRSGFPTVIGTGSDAHLATGTAALLRDHHPTAIAPEEPVDRVPLVWRSKPPVYYPLAAVATMSGLETWEAFPVVAALLMALAAARLLPARARRARRRAGRRGRRHGAGRPRPRRPAHRRPPLLQPALGLPHAAVRARARMVGGRARARAARSRCSRSSSPSARSRTRSRCRSRSSRSPPCCGPSADARLRGARLWRGPRSLLWIVPLAALLAYPAVRRRGEGDQRGRTRRRPGPLAGDWGGDLFAFSPEHEFLALPIAAALIVLGPLLAVAIVLELRRQPRGLALALGSVLVFGVVAALWFRSRDIGWYFHFKALAFTGPLAVLSRRSACRGAERRRARPGDPGLARAPRRDRRDAGHLPQRPRR